MRTNLYQFLKEQKTIADSIIGFSKSIAGLEAEIKACHLEQKLKNIAYWENNSDYNTEGTIDFLKRKGLNEFLSEIDGSFYHDGEGNLYRIAVAEGIFSFQPVYYLGPQIGCTPKQRDDSETSTVNQTKAVEELTIDEAENVFVAIAYGRDFLEANLNYLKLFPDDCIPSWSDSFTIEGVHDSCSTALAVVFLTSTNMDPIIDAVDVRQEVFGINGGLIPGCEIADYLDTDLTIDAEIKRWYWDGIKTSIDIHPVPTPLQDKIKDFAQHLSVKLHKIEETGRQNNDPRQ